MDVEGVNQKGEKGDNGWAKWLRHWTGEENRHGDVLNKYLYLSGRVNMREVEITTHHLINDGFDQEPIEILIKTLYLQVFKN